MPLARSPATAFLQAFGAQDPGGAFARGAERGVGSEMDWADYMRKVGEQDTRAARVTGEQRAYQTEQDKKKLLDTIAQRVGELKLYQQNPQTSKYLQGITPESIAESGGNVNIGDIVQRLATLEGIKAQMAGRDKPARYEPMVGDLPFKTVVDPNDPYQRPVKARDYDLVRSDWGIDVSVPDSEIGRAYSMPKSQRRDGYLARLAARHPAEGLPPQPPAAIGDAFEMKMEQAKANPQAALDQINSLDDATLVKVFGFGKAEAVARWQRKFGGGGGGPAIPSPTPGGWPAYPAGPGEGF